MISRFLALAVLLTLAAFNGVHAHAEGPETAAIVEAVYRTGPVKSFMLQRGGKLLIDAHRRGMRAQRATNVKSVARSVMSLLVGIAIEQGHLRGVWG